MDLQWLESGEMPPEDLDSLSRNLAFHLKHLVDERDTQLEVMTYEFFVWVRDLVRDRFVEPSFYHLGNITQTTKIQRYNRAKHNEKCLFLFSSFGCV